TDVEDPIGVGERGEHTCDVWFVHQAAPLHLVPTVFPPATEGDPEGERDQAHVEPETGLADVHAVVAELVAPLDVPRRVDLRDPGEPWAHAVSLGVTRDILERLEAAVAGGLDLARA